MIDQVIYKREFHNRNFIAVVDSPITDKCNKRKEKISITARNRSRFDFSLYGVT
jgi:hypothetical protein